MAERPSLRAVYARGLARSVEDSATASLCKMPQQPESGPNEVLDLAGQVRPPTIEGLPVGYRYGVTRYADVILQEAFRDRFDDLQEALEGFRPTLDELRAGGGGRTVFVRRFDDSLSSTGREEHAEDRPTWGKQNITIEKSIGFDGDTRPVSRVRGARDRHVRSRLARRAQASRSRWNGTTRTPSSTEI